MLLLSSYTNLQSLIFKMSLCVVIYILLFPALVFAEAAVDIYGAESQSPDGSASVPQQNTESQSPDGSASVPASNSVSAERAASAGTDPGSVTVRPGGSYSPCQEFVPLVGIPGLTDSVIHRDREGKCPTNVNSDQILTTLLQTLYRLAIVAGALIAVLKITMAGLQYMGTSSIGNKEGAINDIQSALLGLVIILSAVLIMETISGQVNLNVLNGAPQVNGQGSPISLTSGSVNPASSQVQSTLGCGQTGSGTGRQCANNGTAVIQNGSVVCVSDPTLGSGFRPMTETECQNAALVEGEVAQVVGYQTVQHDTRTDYQKLEAQKLEECRAQSGNPNARIEIDWAAVPVNNPTNRATVAFICIK